MDCRVKPGNDDPPHAGALALAARYSFTSWAGQPEIGIVFRRILDLLEIVQAAILVDAVGARDQPRRARGIRVEVLMNRARGDVDYVPRFPLEALDLGLRLPAIGVDDLDVAVLMQIVAVTLDHVEALFRQVPVLARP